MSGFRLTDSGLKKLIEVAGDMLSRNCGGYLR